MNGHCMNLYVVFSTEVFPTQFTGPWFSTSVKSQVSLHVAEL